MTGNSTDGEGGSIELFAGSSAVTTVYSRSRIEGVDGPDVSLKAGDAISQKSTGGNVMLFAGHGTNYDRWDGGNGGNIELIAGAGHGHNRETDFGGDVIITGGASAFSNGGSFSMKSGPGLEGSSGNVTIVSDNSGRVGVSGSVNVSSGFSRWGSSGDITLKTGEALKYGHAGDIVLEVGNTNADETDGGNIYAIAGASSSMFGKSSLLCSPCRLEQQLYLIAIIYYCQLLGEACFSKVVKGGTHQFMMELMADL